MAKIANMETTVLKAKNNLSQLLAQAERGEEVLIRRGRRGTLFRLAPVKTAVTRTLKPRAVWAGKIRYTDAELLDSEWREEA